MSLWEAVYPWNYLQSQCWSGHVISRGGAELPQAPACIRSGAVHSCQSLCGRALRVPAPRTASHPWLTAWPRGARLVHVIESFSSCPCVKPNLWIRPNLFLPCTYLHLYHFSRCYIYAFLRDIRFPPSDLLHSIWQFPGPPTSLHTTPEMLVLKETASGRRLYGKCKGWDQYAIFCETWIFFVNWLFFFFSGLEHFCIIHVTLWGKRRAGDDFLRNCQEDHTEAQP